MNACLAYWSDLRLSIKSINDDVPHTPKRQKRALGRRKGPDTHRGQDLINHDESPRTSKPSSLSEEPDSRVLRGYCGAKESSNLGPFHTKPKGPHREGRNVRGWTKKVWTAKRRCRRQSCSRQTEIIEGENGTPLRAVSQSIPRESTSATRQPWENSGRTILGQVVTSALNTHS